MVAQATSQSPCPLLSVEVFEEGGLSRTQTYRVQNRNCRAQYVTKCQVPIVTE